MPFAQTPDQLHLTLVYDDGRPVPPPLGSVGADLYAAVEPLAWVDPEHDWALAHLCEALGRLSQELEDLIRDPDEGRTWSKLLDVDTAPGAGGRIDALPWLAQLAGVRLPAGLSDGERRDAIRRRSGTWRGTTDAVVSVAERFVADGVGVTLRERYSDALPIGSDAPYHGQVRFRSSRLLPGSDETTIARAVLAEIPAGLRYAIVFSDERDYEMVAGEWTSYAGVAALTYDDLLSA
jgi:hypothetical protein